MDVRKLGEIAGFGEDRSAFFRFIMDYANMDPGKLRLKYCGKVFKPETSSYSNPDPQSHSVGFDTGFAIDQIECRQRTRSKLPRFLMVKEIIFPAVVCSEQASDEGIALFHASLLGREERVADLTAGLGIDAMIMAGSCKEMTAVELDPFRAEVLQYNAGLLGVRNLKVINADSMEWLRGEVKYDVLFIDPARRGEFNSRRYRFADCAPDIVRHYSLLLSKCTRLLVKASPLLDISAVREELPGVTRIWVLSRKGECKELLLEVRKDGKLETVTAAEIDADGKAEEFILRAANLGNTGVRYADFSPEVDMWIYEPEAAVMKIAPWGEICRRWPDIYKVGANSNLFVSLHQIERFPGKEYRIIEIPEKKTLKKLKGTKANVITRNYPLTPAELRKKTGIKDGGENFVIATRWSPKETPILLLAERLPKNQ